MPAGLLVMCILGALALDVAAVHQAQRELVTVAEAAANDAAVASWDEASFYRDGSVQVDAAAARRTAIARVRAADPTLRTLSVRVVGTEIHVTVAGTVQPIFGRAAGARSVEIIGRAHAELVR